MSFAIGRDVSFTWTSGAEALVVANFNEVFYVEERALHETTPPNYYGQRYTEGNITAYGFVRGYHDTSGATPPTPGGNGPPTGTVGTLAFTLATGDTKTFKASFHRLTMQSTTQGGSPPQAWQYFWRFNPQAPTDTIVTA